MKKPCILRKRYIPDETVDISGDELLYRDAEMLITRWNAIRPRADISGGISYAFLKEGIKISKFFNNSGEFIYWYCDIIDIDYDDSCDKYVLIDLLLDVKLMPDGKVIVMDADELAEAMESGLVTKEQACRALRNMNKIVNMMYEGIFPPAICKDERFS